MQSSIHKALTLRIRVFCRYSQGLVFIRWGLGYNVKCEMFYTMNTKPYEYGSQIKNKYVAPYQRLFENWSKVYNIYCISIVCQHNQSQITNSKIFVWLFWTKPYASWQLWVSDYLFKCSTMLSLWKDFKTQHLSNVRLIGLPLALFCVIQKYLLVSSPEVYHAF